MKRQIRLSRATAAVLCSSVLATTRRVHARFEVEERGPFPSDRFIVEDKHQLTGIHVKLPASEFLPQFRKSELDSNDN